MFGEVRLLMAIEEHGSGKQNVRFRVWPRIPRVALSLIPFPIFAIWAAAEGAPVAAAAIAGVGVAAGTMILAHLGAAQERVETTLRELDRGS
jgi:hypothetical protein